MLNAYLYNKLVLTCVNFYLLQEDINELKLKYRYSELKNKQNLAGKYKGLNELAIYLFSIQSNDSCPFLTQKEATQVRNILELVLGRMDYMTSY